MTIKPGQIYRSCDPRGGLRYEPGWARAEVVNAYDGKRPRPVLAAALHDTPTTRDGKLRRTGYALEAR